MLECLFRNGNVLEMCDGEGVCEKCARNVLELWVLPRGCARRAAPIARRAAPCARMRPDVLEEPPRMCWGCARNS